MTLYIENDDITIKIEYTESDEIGWSSLDTCSIYRATVIEFSISRGVISRQTKVVNGDGSDYRPAYYRNLVHQVVPV